jgi:hypothetical protein
MNFKNKDAKVVNDDLTPDRATINNLQKFVRVGTDNQREGYKKALENSNVKEMKK